MIIVNLLGASGTMHRWIFFCPSLPSISKQKLASWIVMSPLFHSNCQSLFLLTMQFPLPFSRFICPPSLNFLVCRRKVIYFHITGESFFCIQTFNCASQFMSYSSSMFLFWQAGKDHYVYAVPAFFFLSSSSFFLFSFSSGVRRRKGTYNPVQYIWSVVVLKCNRSIFIANCNVHCIERTVQCPHWTPHIVQRIKLNNSNLLL